MTVSFYYARSLRQPNGAAHGDSRRPKPARAPRDASDKQDRGLAAAAGYGSGGIDQG
jgi:hypothetical protein